MMIEGGSGLASGNGAVSYRRWVCLHGVFGYQLNQVHGVPKSMALCTGFHCQYQLGTRIIIRVQTTKRTVSEGPSQDILVQVGHSRLAWLREVSSKFLARHSDNRSVGSAVDDIAKSTNFHHQLQPLLK